MERMNTMVIKVDGVWHQANVAQTATVCGLDPDDAEDVRPSLPYGATLHDGCAHAGEPAAPAEAE